MVGLEDRQPGLGAKERRVQLSFDRAISPQQPRFTMPLPQGPGKPKEITEAKALVSAAASPLPSAQSAVPEGTPSGGRLPGELMRQRDVRSVVALPEQDCSEALWDRRGQPISECRAGFSGEPFNSELS